MSNPPETNSVSASDEPTTRPTSPFSSGQRLRGVTANLDVITAAVLIILVAFSAAILRNVPPRIMGITGVDYSWFIDVVFKAKQGVFLGRDVAFTYGPLFQWLWATSSNIIGLSVGSIFRFGPVLPFAYCVVLCLGAARMLLREQPSWARALFIFALLSRWNYFEVRGTTTVFVFALCVREFYLVSKFRELSFRRAALLGMGIILAFSVSTDTGVYSIMAVGIVSGMAILLSREKGTAKLLLGFAAATGAFATAYMLLLALIFIHSMLPYYLKATAALMSTYRWSMAMPLGQSRDLPQWFRLIIAACIALFVVAWLCRKRSARSLAASPIFLASAPLFCLLHLQSGFVRADGLHILFALFPMLGLAGVELLGFTGVRRSLDLTVALLALGLMVIFTDHFSLFVPTMVSSAVIEHGKTLCRPKTEYFQGVCTSPSDASDLRAISSYIQEHTAANDPVFVFPYQNTYGDVAGRRVAGSVLQNYVAIGKTLVRDQLQALEHEQPPLAIYSADVVTSWMIDGVPHLTRSPEIWMYLQSHYRSAAEIIPGTLALRRDEERTRQWRMQSTDLPISRGAQKVRGSQILLFDVSGPLNWPLQADLLKIQVVVHYPFLWNFSKPARLFVAVERPNGEWKFIIVVAQPNRLTTLYLYPWFEGDLQRYFSPRVTAWRPGPREPVVWIRMGARPMDLFSVMPTEIEIRRVEAVQLDLATDAQR